MRFEGRLIRWEHTRGFGFIESIQGGEPIFVHIKAFKGNGKRPVAGDLVSFEIEVGPKGKRARGVEWLASPPQVPKSQQERPVSWGFFSLGALVTLVATYTAIWAVWGISHAWAGLYMVLSLVTALAYAQDKSAARLGRWRTSEQALHLLGVLGGWPGGLWMQKALRHKSSKSSFQMVFWSSVIANLTAFVVLNHPRIRGHLPWGAV